MLLRPRVLTVLVLAVTATSLVPLLVLHPLDLSVYRLGGRAVLHGDPLYRQRIGPYGFTYPPVAALLAVPFAIVPFGVASAGLAAASLASLWVLVRRGTGDLLARLQAAPTVWGAVALVALACCAPVRGTFWNGQVNLVLAALVLADVQGRRWRGAGVGLAAAIKLTPAIFVLYLVMCGRRREARNAIASGALVTALAWVVLPGDSVRFWTHQLAAASGDATAFGDEARTSNQSLHGVLLRLVGTQRIGSVWLPLACVAAVAGLRIAVRLAREGRTSFAVGVVGVTGCVVSPVSWVHHWVWAVPWLVGLATSARRPGTRVWVATVATVVIGWDRLPLTALPRWPLLTFLGRNDLVLCAVLSGVVATCRMAVVARSARDGAATRARRIGPRATDVQVDAGRGARDEPGAATHSPARP